MSSAATPSASTSAPYSQQQQQRSTQRQRPRSAGSAFKRIAEASDLRPLDSKLSGRRANPDGGTISVGTLSASLRHWTSYTATNSACDSAYSP
jgi:hypothetical protein